MTRSSTSCQNRAADSALSHHFEEAVRTWEEEEENYGHEAAHVTKHTLLYPFDFGSSSQILSFYCCE